MEQKRYESDMTPKEKRELEKKKLKQMTFPQKVEYIWAYYKLHMAIALAIILVIVFVGQLIYRSQFDTVFYAAIINGSAGDGEALAQDFKTYTGDTDKYHEYTVDNSMYLVKDQEDYNMVMKLSTIIGAQQVDVLIAPEYKFQEYVDQGGFYPMSELLTDEQQEAYKDQLTEYGLKVGDSEVLKAHGMQVDEDACLGVLIYSDHLEEAKSFITYIMGDGNTPDENEGGQQ